MQEPVSSPHISYAMRNTEATEQFLTFNAPSDLIDWSFLAIEWTMIAGAILAFVHAVRTSKRTSSPSALYTFAGIFLYGLVMDVSSYYSVENFWHGEFSVMLVWNRLPFYIAMLYPALLYHCYMTIHRFAFSPLVEAVCTAFYTGILYMIFDNLGPSLNWWIWDRESAFSQPLLDSVPVTSYHWMFLFSGTMSYGLRIFCWDAVAKNNLKKARMGTAFMPFIIIIPGCILFIPYNLFLFGLENMLWAAVLIHCLSFFAAGFLLVTALLSSTRQTAHRDNLLLFFPLFWIAAHIYIYAAKFESLWAVTSDGLNVDGLAIGNLYVVGIAVIIGTAMTLAAHRRKY
jgi:hypothetical protein